MKRWLLFLFMIPNTLYAGGELSKRYPNIVGLWHLDEGIGTTIQDAMNEGATGTFCAGGATPPIWVLGKFGNGLQFDYTVFNCVAFENESKFDFGTSDPFYIALWVGIGNQIGGGKWIMQKYPTGGLSPGWALKHSVDTLGDISFIVQSDFGSSDYCQMSTVRTFPNLDMNNMHFIVASWDGANNCTSSIAIYVDGSSEPLKDIGTVSSLTGSILNNQKVGISGNFNSSPFTGKIDEVAIFRGKVTLQEVKSLYYYFRHRKASETSEN